MVKTTSFRDFILDQLSDLHGLTSRAMFGGYGIYQDGLFFGLIAGDELYFKTDAESLLIYLERDMKPFEPETKEHSYYAVPIEIIEDREELTAWAIRAREAQVKAKAAKPDKPKRKKADGAKSSKRAYGEDKMSDREENKHRSSEPTSGLKDEDNHMGATENQVIPNNPPTEALDKLNDQPKSHADNPNEFTANDELTPG